MMHIFKFFVVVLLFTTLSAKAQNTDTLRAEVQDGVYNKHIIDTRKPVKLPTVREADVVWSKTVWRIINLREKLNQSLYYPTQDMERLSITNVLLKGIEDGEITAYDATRGDEFSNPITYESVKAAFGAMPKTVQRRNFETGVMEEVIVTQDIPVQEVKELMIKEVWFFDLKTSSMQVRILGLCPIQEFYRESDVEREEPQRRMVFWVYYPNVRSLLARYEALNPYNNARNISFDDLFVTRKFDSYIVRESNAHNNRSIDQYASGEAALDESERIKNTIFNYEQDLWEY